MVLGPIIEACKFFFLISANMSYLQMPSCQDLAIFMLIYTLYNHV